MRVVRGELEMPFELPSSQIERDNRAGVKIVAAPAASVEIRPGISGRPVEQIQIGIEGSAEPGGPAAPLHRKIAPGLRARLALGGNGVESPELFASGRRVRGDEATHAAIAARDPHYDAVLEGQR